jgi:hypothetical protein
MATGKQARAKRLSMSDRAELQLELHFTNYEKQWLWKRKVNDGYTTVPRTLPFVMQAIDEASKGHPAGHTLFCLWARSPDHPLLVIENPATFAAEAGFSGERLLDTWRRRMKRLKELHFIDVKKGDAGDFNYVLLLNPNVAMEHMYQQGLVQKNLYSRFLIRATDVGAYSEIANIQSHWDLLRKEAENAKKDAAKKKPAKQTMPQSSVATKPVQPPIPLQPATQEAP